MYNTTDVQQPVFLVVICPAYRILALITPKVEKSAKHVGNYMG